MRIVSPKDSRRTYLLVLPCEGRSKRDEPDFIVIRAQTGSSDIPFAVNSHLHDLARARHLSPSPTPCYRRRHHDG